MTIGRAAGGVGGVGGVGDGVLAHAIIQESRSARAKALAVHLFVGVFEVRVPVQTVFVEAQEAP